MNTNTAVDINATFNTVGDIKPVYIRLENEKHELETFKIQRITNQKNEKYSGINSLLFYCVIHVENIEKEIKIRYYIDSHKWVTIHN